MIRNIKQNQPNNESKPMLTWRLINSLPMVPTLKALYPSAKELYFNTKISNPILYAGLDYAEDSIATASAPFLSRYEKIDSFASSKLEQLEEAYEEGLPSLAKKGAMQSVRAVAYPVGFTLEMAHQARSKAIELATPAIERAFGVANEVVDVLVPGEPNEDAYDGVSGLTNMQIRSPVRRLRRRMNARALSQLPVNTLYYSLGVASALSYEGLFIGRALHDRLWMELDRSLYVLAGLEAFLVAQPLSVLGHNLKQAKRVAAENTEFVVQALLANALVRSSKLRSQLEDAKLPKTAHLVHRLSDDLKNLSAFFGIHAGDAEHPMMIETNEPALAPAAARAPARARRVLPSKRTRVQELSRKHVNPFMGDQRMPTFFSGNDALIRTEQIESERTSGIMTGEGVEEMPPVLTVEAIDMDAFNSSGSHPGSGNVSEIDESDDVRRAAKFLSVKHAGQLTSAFLRNLRGHKTIPPTPANSPVPQSLATPNMPMVVITQQVPESVDVEGENVVTALLEEKLDGKHATFHMPTIIVSKSSGKKTIADSNPFDALANGSDMMDSPKTERRGADYYALNHPSRGNRHHHSHTHRTHEEVPQEVTVVAEELQNVELVVPEAEVEAELEADKTEQDVKVEKEGDVTVQEEQQQPIAEEHHESHHEHHHHAKPVHHHATVASEHHVPADPNANPFASLADAPDPMGSPLMVKKNHHNHAHPSHTHTHANQAGQASI